MKYSSGRVRELRDKKNISLHRRQSDTCRDLAAKWNIYAPKSGNEYLIVRNRSFILLHAIGISRALFVKNSREKGSKKQTRAR